MREAFWAAAAALAGALFISHGFAQHKLGDQVAGAVFVVAALALGRNLVRRVPILTIHGEGGMARVVAEAELSPTDLESINARLDEELGWPVDR
jgi:hypothetical protein